MSIPRLHHELIPVAKQLGASSVTIHFKGKPSTIGGQTGHGDTFYLEFSDTPGRGYLDRLFMVKLERVSQGAA